MRVCLRCKKVGAGVERCTEKDRDRCIIADRHTRFVASGDVIPETVQQGALIEMPKIETISSHVQGDAAPPIVIADPRATPGGQVGEPVVVLADPPKEVTSGTLAGSLLSEAAGIVEGVRNQQHGHKERSFEAIARMWSAYLMSRKKPVGPVRAHDVAQMMVLLKQQRAEWGTPVRDHFVDAAGYSGIAGEIVIRAQEDEGEL